MPRRDEEPGRASTDEIGGADASLWFAAIDPEVHAAPPSPSPRLPYLAIPLGLGGVASAAFGPVAEIRVGLALVCLTAMLVVFVRWTRAWGRAARDEQRAALPVAPRRSTSRGLAVDLDRVAFVSEGSLHPHELRLDGPFGVTLLASPRRERVIALLSSASGTFYLGATFDASARRAFAPLLDRAFTVVGDDAGMEAIAPDGAPLVLAPEELASLLEALVERSPTCLDRFVLTDARGALITLDGQKLHVGERAVDLQAPLEWRSIVFQEAFGQAIAVYQGTWIRQSATELTLVSLMPALGPALASELDANTLDRGALRDLRLMQATPEAPPPNDQRVAIDRLFMLPVRSALDAAPRSSRPSHRKERLRWGTQ